MPFLAALLSFRHCIRTRKPAFPRGAAVFQHLPPRVQLGKNGGRVDFEAFFAWWQRINSTDYDKTWWDKSRSAVLLLPIHELLAPSLRPLLLTVASA